MMAHCFPEGTSTRSAKGRHQRFFTRDKILPSRPEVLLHCFSRLGFRTGRVLAGSTHTALRDSVLDGGKLSASHLNSYMAANAKLRESNRMGKSDGAAKVSG